MSRKRVLIVDDDAPFLELLQLYFAKANFDVILASNGADALKILFESEPPDLVLSDFMMPEVNGIELVRHLKANAKLFDTPVALMSSNVDTEFRKRALDLGASAYLLKTEGAHAVAEKAIHMGASSFRVNRPSRSDAAKPLGAHSYYDADGWTAGAGQKRPDHGRETGGEPFCRRSGILNMNGSPSHFLSIRTIHSRSR
jgi:CheY-like chemotaxis protein